MDVKNMSISTVGLIETGLKEYPRTPPFAPPMIFPEFPYSDNSIDKDNYIYSSIRELFIKLNLDIKNLNTSNWNPLGKFIKPGDKVIIKPNFVREAKTKGVDVHSIVTNGSILRPIVDYCQIALKGRGKLTIADAPQFDANFEKIIKITGTSQLVKYINKIAPLNIDLLDLREERVIYSENVIINRFKLAGDPEGYTIVNLGTNSEFHKIEKFCNKIFGADYDIKETRRHHQNNIHEYKISNTILNSDVFINVPKLKTHKKAGISVSLKNLIGINGNKNYLPHFRFGTKNLGGDEYEGDSVLNNLNSKFFNFMFKFLSNFRSAGANLMRIPGLFYPGLKKANIAVHQAGDWYGNDTIWRTILDLNKILLYSNKQGEMQFEKQRKYFSIIDGVIAGEREGPLNPSSKKCGLIIGGFDPVSTDITSSRIMGFDYKKIPQIEKSLDIDKYNLGLTRPFEIKIVSNNKKWLNLWMKDENFKFEPHMGWKNAIEMDQIKSKSN
jgi:uncharacterized protein (DUF362 family)